MSQERGDCSRTADHSITEYVITRHELALPFIFQQTNISQLLLIKNRSRKKVSLLFKEFDVKPLTLLSCVYTRQYNPDPYF